MSRLFHNDLYPKLSDMPYFENSYEDLNYSDDYDEEFLLEEEEYYDEEYDELYNEEEYEEESFDVNLFRSFLGEDYQGLPDESVRTIYANTLQGLTEEEQIQFESFWGSLSKGLGAVGQGIVQALPTIAPIIGGVAGTALGGPVGGMIGSQLGNVVGGLASPTSNRPPQNRPPQNRPVAPVRPTPRPPGRPVTRPAPAVNTNSNASTQLMSLLTNPALLQSIMGMVVGQPSRRTVPVATNTQTQNVPYGAFMNLLSVLARRAAGEAYEIGAEENDSYLMNAAGEHMVDPQDDEARANQLIKLLNETVGLYHQQSYQEVHGHAEEYYDEAFDDLDEEYYDEADYDY